MRKIFFEKLRCPNDDNNKNNYYIDIKYFGGK